jgi:hypothetical protein
LAWLREVEPNNAEWQVVAPLLRDPSGPLFNRALRVLTTPVWFDRADANGAIEGGLNGDLAKQYVWLLTQVDAARPERVAELLRERVEEDEAWASHARNVLAYADIAKDRGLFELFVKMLDNDRSYDDRLGTGDFWYVAHAFLRSRSDI